MKGSFDAALIALELGTTCDLWLRKYCSTFEAKTAGQLPDEDPFLAGYQTSRHQSHAQQLGPRHLNKPVHRTTSRD